MSMYPSFTTIEILKSDKNTTGVFNGIQDTQPLLTEPYQMGQNLGHLGPSELNDLMMDTFFTQNEIVEWYEKFKKDYPHGYMKRKDFIKLYKTFYRNCDAQKFSEHVFRVFDVNNDGKIGKNIDYSTVGIPFPSPK